MKIAISGATGFIGSYLTEIFQSKGYEVIPLTRAVFQEGAEDKLNVALNGCDVVINLAGVPINHRWTKRYKQLMYDSRVGVTRKLVRAINALAVKPKLLISTSAVGYYPSLGCFDENSTQPGNSFLAKLCVEWERESQHVSPEVRLVNPRFGVVLAPEGGAFPQMVKSAKLGVATAIGNGKQPFPWISLEDHGRALEFIISNEGIRGIVNLVAPESATNYQFTKAVTKHFRCFTILRIPKFMFSLLMGEAAQLVVDGQCVKPTKLVEAGFTFQSNTITDFLEKV